MKLSQEAFLGLKRHFLGVLVEPSPLWVAPAQRPSLLLTSDAPRGERGCIVDFGTVESPGAEHRTLRLVNLGEEALTLRVQNANAWLQAHWLPEGEVLQLEGRSAALLVAAAHDFLEDTFLTGTIELVADGLEGQRRICAIAVRLATRRTQALGRYGFEGEPEPRPHDFGRLDAAAVGAGEPPSYELSFESLTSIPLVVSFADLPAWLVFAVNGYQRRGPVSGRFFERVAPFRVEIRPNRSLQFLGVQRGRVVLHTNDARPAWQRLDLEFAAEIESAKPYLTLTPLERVRVPAGEVVWVEATLTNWGQSPARVSLRSRSPALQLPDRPAVPSLHDGQPGQVALRIRLVSTGLAQGTHALSLTLRVENGEPPEINIPIWVDVTAVAPGATTAQAQQPSRLSAAVAVAAVVLLLILLVALVF